MSNRHYSMKENELKQLSSRLISITASRDDGDWKSVPHTHHFTELLFVSEGKGTFYAGESSFPIQKGDLVITPPYLEHTERSGKNISMEYYVLGVEGISFLEKENPNGTIYCNLRNDSSIPLYFGQMLEEIQAQKYGSETVCQHILEILILKLLRAHQITPVPTASVRMTKECAQIKEYLDANYADHITLDKLTDLTHMNKYYIVHSFRKYTGLSPIQYLNQRRLDMACQLLKSSNHSVCDIASLTGFSSQSYFTQIFKKAYQTTPIKYRSQHLKEK